MDYVKFMRWLIAQPDGAVMWRSTQRDLVELVAVVASKREIRDRRGFPLTQRELARRAFAAVGLPVPRDLSHIVWCIRNRVREMPSLDKRIMYI